MVISHLYFSLMSCHHFRMKTFRFFECVYYVLLAIVVYYSLESADFASLEVVEVYNVSSGN